MENNFTSSVSENVIHAVAWRNMFSGREAVLSLFDLMKNSNDADNMPVVITAKEWDYIVTQLRYLDEIRQT